MIALPIFTCALFERSANVQRSEPAPAPPVPDRSDERVTAAFDIGMRTGFLFAQRGGTSPQLNALARYAAKDRAAVVMGILEGKLPPAIIPPSPTVITIDPPVIVPDLITGTNKPTP